MWEYPTEDEDGAATHTDLFMDVGEPVRFRVAGETFTDTGPSSRPDVAPEVRIVKNFYFFVRSENEFLQKKFLLCTFFCGFSLSEIAV